MLVATRRTLGRALDTQQFYEEIDPFLPGVPCCEKMNGGHSIPERNKAICHRVCPTLLNLLVDWWIKFSVLKRFSGDLEALCGQPRRSPSSLIDNEKTFGYS